MIPDQASPLPVLEEWKQLSQHMCEGIAKSILARLPESFRFVKVETCQLGAWQHRVAFFEWKPLSASHSGILFAFLPGTRTVLGYDKMKPFLPSATQWKSWREETAEKGRTPDTLETFLEKHLTPVRQVSLQPFLLQVEATSFDRLPSGGDPVRYPGRNYLRRPEVLHILDQERFRLPSSDEWEYACGAEASTLFRWGDDTPDCRGARPHQVGEEGTVWDLHLRPNAFGLKIANDSYRWEFCAEPEILRGGDGGTARSSGAGIFAEWLTLATSLFVKLPDWRLKPEMSPRAHFRRAYALE